MITDQLRAGPLLQVAGVRVIPISRMNVTADRFGAFAMLAPVAVVVIDGAGEAVVWTAEGRLEAVASWLENVPELTVLMTS